MKLTNNSRSPQGFRDATGRLVWIEPGASLDIDTDRAAALRIPGMVEDDPYSDMDDDILRLLVEEKTGKMPSARTGRAKLIEALR